MSYIIKNNAIVAKLNAELASGTEVSYSFAKVAEEINAARDFNLVGARTATIGNGAKWDAKWSKVEGDNFVFGKEINPGEFFVS